MWSSNRLAKSYYQKYLDKFGPTPAPDEVSIPPNPPRGPNYNQVDISQLEVTEIRTFGAAAFYPAHVHWVRVRI
jgi:hypothetical protein